MSVTLANLYQRTGTKLEILRAEQNLSAEDGKIIADMYASLHDQLLTEGLMNWGVTDEVPDWAAPIITDMLSSLLVDEFGVEEPRRTTVKLEGALGNAPVSPAERKLRRQLALPYVPNAIQTSQF